MCHNPLCSRGHAALSQIDPAAHNFKILLRHVVSRVMDAIPSKLLDQELGIKSVTSQNEEVGPESQPTEATQGDQAQQAEHAQQDAESKKDQQAADSQHAKHDGGNDGDFEEEEEGRVRLPLFTNKVMILVQDLLQYKVCTCLQVVLTLGLSTASMSTSFYVFPKELLVCRLSSVLHHTLPKLQLLHLPWLSHCLASAHRMMSQLLSWLPTAQWRRQPSATGQPSCL
jgi:hypothetical protein